MELADDDLRASCTCPYGGNGYCKHVVATWLAPADRNPDDEQPAVERQLECADSEEQCEFLRAECADNPNFRFWKEKSRQDYCSANSESLCVYPPEEIRTATTQQRHPSAGPRLSTQARIL
ncbi:SWIM zinc finger family protein [Haladaptatus sp. NG-WS-4]